MNSIRRNLCLRFDGSWRPGFFSCLSSATNTQQRWRFINVEYVERDEFLGPTKTFMIQNEYFRTCLDYADTTLVKFSPCDSTNEKQWYFFSNFGELIDSGLFRSRVGTKCFKESLMSDCSYATDSEFIKNYVQFFENGNIVWYGRQRCLKPQSEPATEGTIFDALIDSAFCTMKYNTRFRAIAVYETVTQDDNSPKSANTDYFYDFQQT